MDPGTVANQVISAGTALCGLILVFLGAVFASFNSFDAEQKPQGKCNLFDQMPEKQRGLRGCHTSN